LIESRLHGGPFLSLADLCDRIPPNQLNRRALEALIHSGALDALDPQANRAQLMADLDLVLDWASARAKDRASGQGNLLDLLGGAQESSSPASEAMLAPKAAPVAEYAPSEKLRLEKEIVGFYLSDHPLKQWHGAQRFLAPIGLASLEEQPDRGKISLLAMVAECRQVTTRKGDRMAVLLLEDLTGSCEAVVFPKSYGRLADHLMVDARLMVWASVDRRDDRVQVIVDDCCSIEELRFLIVELPVEKAGDIAIQHRLRECLQRHRPEQELGAHRVPVVAKVQAAAGCRYVRLGPQFCVGDASSALQTLEAAKFQASLLEAAGAPTL
jgi:DNA polymerase-3 subunit alpha